MSGGYYHNLPAPEDADGITMEHVLKLIPFGEQNAVRADVIAGQLGIDDKKTNSFVRKLIREAIQDGHLIGSCSDGYYRISCVTEFDDYVNQLRTRIQGIEKRIEFLHDTWNRNSAVGMLFKTISHRVVFCLTVRSCIAEVRRCNQAKEDEVSQTIFEEMWNRLDNFCREFDRVAEACLRRDMEVRAKMLTRINNVRMTRGWRPVTKSEFDEMTHDACVSLYERHLKA